MSEREPIFNLPGAVIGTIVLLAAVHGTLALLEPREELRWLLTLAFIPARYSGLAGEIPGAPYAVFTSFLSHMLVHGSLVHLAMNTVWLLAFGGAVALRLGNSRYLLLFVLTGVAGAAAFLAFNWGRAVPMVGASGAVSGLMGGAFRFFFSSFPDEAEGRRGDPRELPLSSLSEVLSNRRSLTVICLWLAINAVAAIIGPALTGGSGIAWEAHIGGFLAGLTLFGLFDPGPRRAQA